MKNGYPESGKVINGTALNCVLCHHIKLKKNERHAG
jgi:hypothetical protein